MKNTRERFQEGDPITWLQVHNLLPVIVAVISVVTAFYILQGKVELAMERIRVQESSIQANQASITSLQNALHDSQLDIKALQTEKQDVKGVSTVQKVTPTPVK